VKSSDDKIPRHRLVNQRIESARRESPAEVVSALGAMQAQDYSSALWAIGLRSPNATEQGVEQVVAERKIVRTWPMRGTLHFVAADDARWMLELLTPRVIAGTARRTRELELDASTFARCRKVFARVLKDGVCVSREDLLATLDRAGISTLGGRGYHILFRLAQEGLICFGPRSGKAHTFVLLDEWIPRSRILDRDGALAELAARYFTSHGPATLQDFVWWSGLTVTDARAGIAMASEAIVRMQTDCWGPKDQTSGGSDSVRLLPAFDEFLLGYKDRGAVLDVAHSGKVNPGNNGVFMHTVTIEGRVCATWKRVVKKNTVAITAQPFAPLRKRDCVALQAAAERYAQFLGVGAASIVV